MEWFLEGEPLKARTRIITQARMSSSRLPGKVLQVVGGKTLLEHHLQRLQVVGENICVATTLRGSDDPIERLCLQLGIPFVRGSEEDVLSRFDLAAEGWDILVRVTADCPLIDGKLIRQALDEYLRIFPRSVYFSNALVRTFPRGMDFEIFTREMLREAQQKAQAFADREHVTPYLYQDSRFEKKDFVQESKDSDLRLTVDTQEDLLLIRKLIEEHDAHQKSCAEIVKLLRLRPELVAINAGVEQKKISDLGFRRATLEDSKQVFDWRNDPSTRANSLNSQPLVWEDHQEWFAQSLKSPMRQIWMAVCQGQNVGTVREDQINSQSWLSWMVDPKMRGQGLGKKILSEFVKGKSQDFFAKIKNENLQSQAMAKFAGFILEQNEGSLQIWRRR